MTLSRGTQAAFLAASLLFGPSVARGGHRGTSVSIDDGTSPRSCSDIAVDFGGQVAARAEERFVVAPDASKALAIRLTESSGLRVSGMDRSDFEVVLCKAAAEKSDLEKIALSRDGATLTVRGPVEGDWVGYLLVSAPRAAAMDIAARNGPVSLSGLSGRVTVRSENGPIALEDSSGDIDVQAQNGPIHARADGGRLHLRTENGPIGVALSGAQWKGAGLDARAVNGPVSVRIPAGYRSGTSVESLGHSPFQCRGEACAGARRTWNEDRKRLELGEAPVVVKVSTENGPVSVRTGSAGADGETEEDE